MNFRPLHRSVALAMAALALLAGCAWPTRDPVVLKAIKVESEMLTAAWKGGPYDEVPQARWPRAIASLEPEVVWVSPEGVDILMKPDFDGGWGYFVPASGSEEPGPGRPMTDLGGGVYWYSPY